MFHAHLSIFKIKVFFIVIAFSFSPANIWKSMFSSKCLFENWMILSINRAILRIFNKDLHYLWVERVEWCSIIYKIYAYRVYARGTRRVYRNHCHCVIVSPFLCMCLCSFIPRCKGTKFLGEMQVFSNLFCCPFLPRGLCVNSKRIMRANSSNLRWIRWGFSLQTIRM